ncbi:hypothetical protein D9M68_774640 [compost metagenome]
MARPACNAMDSRRCHDASPTPLFPGNRPKRQPVARLPGVARRAARAQPARGCAGNGTGRAPVRPAQQGRIADRGRQASPAARRLDPRTTGPAQVRRAGPRGQTSRHRAPVPGALARASARGRAVPPYRARVSGFALAAVVGPIQRNANGAGNPANRYRIDAQCVRAAGPAHPSRLRRRLFALRTRQALRQAWQDDRLLRDRVPAPGRARPRP